MKTNTLERLGLVQVDGRVMTKAEAGAMHKRKAATPKAPTKAATNAPKASPAPAAKVDLAPLAKAIADQTALTGEKPKTAAPVVDHASARASWDQARAEMLQRTGRA